MSKKHKGNADFISEQEYTKTMSSSTSTDPQSDSPGGADVDETAEFAMGLNYQPDSDGEDLEPSAEEIMAPKLKILKEQKTKLPEVPNEK